MKYPPRRSPFLLLCTCMGLLPALLLGCASSPPPATSNKPAPKLDIAALAAAMSNAAKAPASASSSAAPGAAQPPTLGAAPPFTVVVANAKRTAGLLPVWQREEKTWIELSPSMLNTPLFLSPKLATGIGEAGLYGGLMQSRGALVGRPQLVEFRVVRQQVQLIALNTLFTATPGTPQSLAVAAAYSPSLLASVPVASAPQARTGAILVDASALWQGDLLGLGLQLQRTFRQSYAIDPRNSGLTEVHGQAQSTVFEVNQHFATASIAAPAPTGSPLPTSSVPITVPDPRSLFIQVHYTLSALPDKLMTPRLADPRVGYFTSVVNDFTDDLARTPTRQFINRWRLAKKDPQAAVSDAAKPIVFWLDPTIPDAYRDTITAGILEWNKAFDAIGITHAIAVKTPPKDKPFDTQETGHASIRWMTNMQATFGAIGPSHVDPRTGEILDADIALESLSSRSMRTARSQYLASAASSVTDSPPAERCDHADEAAEQLELGLAMLAEGGIVDPDAPEVRAFVLAYLKDVTMHEVGHALGLRHNFRGSGWRSATALNSMLLTSAQGISATVMDYLPINLPAPGEQGGAPFQTTLGPYDYWAIEYGYATLDDSQPATRQALLAIARRSDEPAQAQALAYGTDEDMATGLDPDIQVFDLGDDPTAFARQRLAIVRDLFKKVVQKPETDPDDASWARRTVLYGWRELGRTSQLLSRQIGGVSTRRVGASSPRDAIDPVPASRQRAALSLLANEFLNADAWALPATLQRKLSPDYLARSIGRDATPADLPMAQQRLAVQRETLGYLMSDTLAERLLDNAARTRDREPHPLLPAELQHRLVTAIWQPGRAPADASAWRDLQREHLNRLAQAVVRNASARADVRATFREEARELLELLRLQASRSRADTATGAHLRDSIDTLTTALAAQVGRPGP